MFIIQPFSLSRTVSLSLAGFYGRSTAIKTRQKYNFSYYFSFFIMLNFSLNKCNRLRNPIFCVIFAAVCKRSTHFINQPTQVNFDHQWIIQDT